MEVWSQLFYDEQVTVEAEVKQHMCVRALYVCVRALCVTCSLGVTAGAEKGTEQDSPSW